MFGVGIKIKTLLFQTKWKRVYGGTNGIIPKRPFPLNNVSIGKYSYGELNLVSFNWNSKLIIGNYVSIAENVTFLLDTDHYIDHISTFPFKAKVVSPFENEAISKGNIIVEDDVWIGYGATILSGVHIGQGAIIAAGSVVTKNVEPYSIVGGVPAKIIKYRFPKESINELIKLDYSKLDIDQIKNHLNDLYKPLINIDDVSWFPKKQ